MKVQWIGVQGTLSSGISDVDTSISSAGLADLPEIVSPDYAKLVIDPAGSDGRPEVVYVTAHTASSTTATISRGEEQVDGGSVARSHASGAIWYHAPTPEDYEGMLVAADEAERESYTVTDGTSVWQQDTNEHWTYVDGATPFWKRNNTYHQFIYNSSGDQLQNRFNTWADLIEALTGEEGPKIILFEQDETIPEGSWNLDNVTLRGSRVPADSGGYTVTFGDNTTLSSWDNALIDGIMVLSTSTTGSIVTYTGSAVLSLTNVGQIQANTEPFIEHNGGQMILSAESGSRVYDGGASIIHDSSSAFAAFLIVSRGRGTRLDADTLSSDNAVIYVDVVGDVGNDLVANSWPQSHTDLVIGVTVPINQTFSQALYFNPTGLTLVTASNVQDAIEEIDAAFPTSDTYSPTVTTVTNLDGATLNNAFYTQVGDFVTVYGSINVDPIAAGACQVDVSLPIASDLGVTADLIGTAAATGIAGEIIGDTTNDRASIYFTAVDGTAFDLQLSFMYEVL